MKGGAGVWYASLMRTILSCRIQLKSGTSILQKANRRLYLKVLFAMLRCVVLLCLIYAVQRTCKVGSVLSGRIKQT